MPAFCHFYPALTPDAFYDLDDDDRTALRDYLLQTVRAAQG